MSQCQGRSSAISGAKVVPQPKTHLQKEHSLGISVLQRRFESPIQSGSVVSRRQRRPVPSYHPGIRNPFRARRLSGSRQASAVPWMLFQD